MARRSERNDP